jgi:O-succinylbenzoic acid--CoA ligase
MAFGITYHHCSEQVIQEIEAIITDWQSLKNEMQVHTSGSTGKPRLIKHERNQVIASAERTNSFFNLRETSSVLLCISPQTIGGKMVIIRALVGNYAVHCVQAQKNPFIQLPIDLHVDFASLVPYQLTEIVATDPTLLKRVGKILIGGANIPTILEETCAKIHDNCFVGYGMTETISHIALRKLKNSYYSVLDGVRITQLNNETIINDSKISIESLVVSDIIESLNEQQFKWIGRSDFVINSGGIKIHPEQLESIVSTYLTTPFIISSIDDRQLGECCVLVSEMPISEELFEKIQKACSNAFGNYYQPKKVIIATVSYLINGKIDRINTRLSINRNHD